MKILITREEGGSWSILDIHAVWLPDGMQWDERNGFRVSPHLREDFEAVIHSVKNNDSTTQTHG